MGRKEAEQPTMRQACSSEKPLDCGGKYPLIWTWFFAIFVLIPYNVYQFFNALLLYCRFFWNFRRNLRCWCCWMQKVFIFRGPQRSRTAYHEIDMPCFNNWFGHNFLEFFDSNHTEHTKFLILSCYCRYFSTFGWTKHLCW